MKLTRNSDANSKRLRMSELSVEGVLEKIPGGNGAGRDPKGISTKDSNLFSDTERARRAAYEAPDEETRNAAWKLVETKAVQTLAHGKDLQIAVWLAMSWIQRYGWGAIQPSLGLLRELQERFWPHFYPPIEFGGERDLGIRIARLASLEHNNALPLILKLLPITCANGNKQYSLSDLRNFQALAGSDPAKDLASRGIGLEGIESFDKAALATSELYYQSVFEAINKSLGELDRLEKFVEQKYKVEGGLDEDDDIPSFGSIKETLNESKDFINYILEKKGASTDRDSDGSDEELSPGSDSQFEGTANRELSAPTSQADALRLLDSVSRYFSRADRHNPANFLIQEAIRWTTMPVSEWFVEIMADQDANRFLGKLMRPPDQK